MRDYLQLSRLIIAVLISMSATPHCSALEPVPGQWNHIPKGLSFAGGGYAYTEADIALDPVLQIEDVEMELDTWVGKYIHTFEMLEKSARVEVTQGYQEGRWTGLLRGVPAAVSRHGLSDTFLRLAVNLYGAPPLSAKEYGAFRNGLTNETIVGAGLVARLPTGDYMEDKLINLGKNRLTLRPQVGVLRRQGKWSAELTGEIAFHTDNDEFFNGNMLEQDPLYIVHGHIIHTFRPGHWAGMSFGYDYGGESTINGVAKDDRKQDTAWAVNYSYPISRSSGIKVSYIRTRTQESIGLDSDTVAGALAIAW